MAVFRTEHLEVKCLEHGLFGQQLQPCGISDFVLEVSQGLKDLLDYFIVEALLGEL